MTDGKSAQIGMLGSFSSSHRIRSSRYDMPMYILELTTPDGRSLTRCSFQPIAPELQTSSPFLVAQGDDSGNTRVLGDATVSGRQLRTEAWLEAPC